MAQVHNLKQTHPLTNARIARGWSQAHLAELLGVSTRTVARWELRQTLPYPIYRERLCRLLGLDISEIGLLPPNQDATKPTKISAVVPEASSLPVAPPLRDPMVPEMQGQASRLLGRSRLLHDVKQSLLGEKSDAITALQGLPGVGKTALALAIVTDEQVQAHFSDGILWVRLGPQADVLEQLRRWGLLLGCKESDISDLSHWSAWAQLLRESIGQRRMLLVIDDAWSVEAAQALQVGGSQCMHILTTRLPHVAFAFAQERTIVVPELDESDGLALLRRFVPQVVDEWKEAARKLVQMVGGLPLGINVLGKYLATQAFTGQPRRVKMGISTLLERRQHMNISLPVPLLDQSLGLTFQSSHSLRETIAPSVESLGAEEQAVLTALAHFPAKPNSFSEEAALAVSGASVERLDALWDAGLLESSGPGRYTMHQTIADYARESGKDQVGREFGRQITVRNYAVQGLPVISGETAGGVTLHS